jgi:hypothetical protein
MMASVRVRHDGLSSNPLIVKDVSRQGGFSKFPAAKRHTLPRGWVCRVYVDFIYTLTELTPLTINNLEDFLP